MACRASLCSPVDFLNSTVSLSLPRFILAAFLSAPCRVGLYRAHCLRFLPAVPCRFFRNVCDLPHFRFDKKDGHRGPASRIARRGCSLRTAPGSVTVGEAGYDPPLGQAYRNRDAISFDEWAGLDHPYIKTSESAGF